MGTDLTLHRQVYTSGGGRRFHVNRLCRALESGQHLNDGGPDDWVPGARWWSMQAVVQRPILAEVRRGYTACRVCVPPEFALPATGETYGHEPVVGFIDGRGLTDICQRCRIPVRRKYVHLMPEGLPLRWPCTSAVVLGLVPRDGAA